MAEDDEARAALFRQEEINRRNARRALLRQQRGPADRRRQLDADWEPVRAWDRERHLGHDRLKEEGEEQIG